MTVKELSRTDDTTSALGYKIEKVHFSRGESHYIASNNGREILIFPADELGEITSWNEVTDLWTVEVSSYLFDLY